MRRRHTFQLGTICVGFDEWGVVNVWRTGKEERKALINVI